MILGVSTALSEAEVHWREFLHSLKERGIGIPDFIVSDAHTDLRAGLKATFNASIWQHCQFHLQQNAQNYITKQGLKSKVASDIAVIFNADNQAHAEEQKKFARPSVSAYLIGWFESPNQFKYQKKIHLLFPCLPHKVNPSFQTNER